MLTNVLSKLSILFLTFFAFSCTPGPAPLRVHSKGPRIAQAVVPSFLKFSISMKDDHGPIAFKLAAPVSLTTGQQIPKGALLEGHYQTNYERVLFSPAFVSYFDSAEHLQRVSLHSSQTARIDLQSANASQLKIQNWFSQSRIELAEGTVCYLDFSL